ncbi:MAG: hypothetical protein IPM29_15845 [Planctomycetes bacterium]|nr:hypothetical protein [Planctomycetota bacterium]
MASSESSFALQPTDPDSWDRLIDAVGPGAPLVVIEAAMSAPLARRYTAADVWQDTLPTRGGIGTSCAGTASARSGAGCSRSRATGSRISPTGTAR